MAANDNFHFLVTERPEENKRMNYMKSNNATSLLRSLFKGLGLVGTVAFAFTAFAPDMMNIPQSMRPWLFVTFIFWFVLYTSGIFSL